MNIDPFEGEFFNTEAISGISDALVRESIQNSLDAATSGDETVTIHFTFFENTTRKSEKIEALDIPGLLPHLQAEHCGLQGMPSFSGQMEYLLIEDFGTRGLQGDIRQFDDLGYDGERNDFYYFWRNIGRTRKGSTDLGRWGLGKTVFQAASRVNTFYGLTVPKNNGQALLMGQCVLKIHKTNGKRYAPYGYFGVMEQDLAIPATDPEFNRRFREYFALKRTNEAGLTILIPYPDSEIGPESFIQSIIKHHFFPILSGKLIVSVHSKNVHHTLDQTSMPQLLKEQKIVEKLELQGLLNLGRWAIEEPENNFIRLKSPTPGKAPKLRENLFKNGQLDKAIQQLNEKKRLAFYIPVSLQKQGEKDFFHGGFSVFLEMDDTLNRPEDYFIRQGITIPEVSSLKQKGFRALVSITEPDLSTFLGDAENPAHTDWERNSKKFKKKYRLGPSTLDFVKSSPRELVKILTQPKKGRNENLLRHIFSLPAQIKNPVTTSKDSQSGPAGGEEENGGAGININSTGHLKLHRIRGGFGLTRGSDPQKVPKYVTVWVAYEVRGGNPFKKYIPLDFDLGQSPIRTLCEGAEILNIGKNVMQFEVKKRDFKIAIAGFDENRDIRVKTNP